MLPQLPVKVTGSSRATGRSDPPRRAAVAFFILCGLLGIFVLTWHSGAATAGPRPRVPFSGSNVGTILPSLHEEKPSLHSPSEREATDPPPPSTSLKPPPRSRVVVPPGFSATLPTADDPRVAHMAAMLGIPSWPPSELAWDPAAHDGREAPLYLQEDMLILPPAVLPSASPHRDGTTVANSIWGRPLTLANRTAVLAKFRSRSGGATAVASEDAQARGTSADAAHAAKNAARLDYAESCAIGQSYGRLFQGTSRHRSANDAAEAARLRIHYGVLSTPKFFINRLLPLLATSLANATTVDIFIRKSLVSHHYVRYLLGKVKETHAHAAGIRVVELYGPRPHPSENGVVYFQNAWMNLEMLRFWKAEALADAGETVAPADIVGIVSTVATLFAADNDGADARKKNEKDTKLLSPHSDTQWYTMGDDDSYILTRAQRAMIVDATRADTAAVNAYASSSAAASSPAAASADCSAAAPLPAHRKQLMLGIPHTMVGTRRSPRGTVVPLAFPHGGPSFLISRGALDATSLTAMQRCEERYQINGGDQVVAYCLADEGALLRATPHLLYSPGRLMHGRNFRDVPFPASFHEHRNATMFARTAALEAMRAERGELVSVDDVIENYSEEGEPPLGGALEAFLRPRLERCLMLARV